MPTNVYATGIELILEERERQLSKLGWSQDHDAQHINDELLQAAMVYMALGTTEAETGQLSVADLKDIWPWPEYAIKITNKLDSLTKAGALIAAEIDRIIYASRQLN